MPAPPFGNNYPSWFAYASIDTVYALGRETSERLVLRTGWVKQFIIG